jgi:hypothetical protein
MKNIFNTFCFLFSFGLHAQNLAFTYTGKVPTGDTTLVYQKNISKDLNIHYLFVSLAYKKKDECWIMVDCGETRQYFLANADWSPIIFKSHASILNYLYQNGWEHQQTLDGTDMPRTHLFKRKL